jgi:hypothetical protein
MLTLSSSARPLDRRHWLAVLPKVSECGSPSPRERESPPPVAGITSLATSPSFAGSGLGVGARCRVDGPTPATRAAPILASVSIVRVCRKIPKHGFPTCASGLSLQALTRSASFDVGVKTSRFLFDVAEYLCDQIIYVLERFWNAAAARCTLPSATLSHFAIRRQETPLARSWITRLVSIFLLGRPGLGNGIGSVAIVSSSRYGQTREVCSIRSAELRQSHRVRASRNIDSLPNRHSPCFLTFLTIGSNWRR